MSRPYYEPKQVYTGLGNVDTYTFDFKIEALSQLLIVVVNELGVETTRVRGTDVTFLSNVAFNSITGGGTIVLTDVLPLNYRMAILLANDEPAQTYEFSNKTSFSLKRFENALDFITGPIQRLVFRGKQAFRIHDLDDEETFNPQFPPGIATMGDHIFAVSDDGTGVKFGPTVTEVEGWKNAAEAAAAAALVSEGNSLASANASEISRLASEAAQVATEAAAAQALIDINAEEALAIAAIDAAESAALAAVAGSTATAQAAAISAEAARDLAQGYAQDALDAAASVTPKYQFLAVQNIAGNGKIIVSNSFPMQFVKVQGNGGPQTTNAAPFVAPPDDGGVITLEGRDNAKILTILANAQMLLKGDMYLGLNQSITMVYELGTDTYREIGRSV